MDNFDLRKYLAEGKLLNEDHDDLIESPSQIKEITVDPKSVQEEISRELFKLNKVFKPMLDKYISLWEDYRNSVENEGDLENNGYYIEKPDEWIKQLKDVKFTLEKGVW